MTPNALSILETIAFWTSLAWVSVTDIRRRTIPNRVLAAALVLRLACCAQQGPARVLMAVASGVALATPALLIGLVCWYAHGRVGVGGGDVKLMFVLGCYVGLWHGMLALAVGCAAGVAYSVTRHLCARVREGERVQEGEHLGKGERLGAQGFPLAPFLLVGCALVRFVAYVR